MELGMGFAFVGSQYRLEVEGDEYFLDLLFYHLRLHCYIVIDLKVTEFRPEYSGKMNFYISAVNNLLCTEVENPTIGIILCRSKKKTTVEFALDAVQNPIGVSTYQLRDGLPPTLLDLLANDRAVGNRIGSSSVEARGEARLVFSNRFAHSICCHFHWRKTFSSSFRWLNRCWHWPI
jgi:hypothetical protein